MFSKTVVTTINVLYMSLPYLMLGKKETDILSSTGQVFQNKPERDHSGIRDQSSISPTGYGVFL